MGGGSETELFRWPSARLCLVDGDERALLQRGPFTLFLAMHSLSPHLVAVEATVTFLLQQGLIYELVLDEKEGLSMHVERLEQLLRIYTNFDYSGIKGIGNKSLDEEDIAGKYYTPDMEGGRRPSAEARGCDYLHFKSTAPEAELDNKTLQLSLAGATSPHASVLPQGKYYTPDMEGGRRPSAEARGCDYLHFKSTAPEAELDNKTLQLSLAGATSPHASVLPQGKYYTPDMEGGRRPSAEAQGCDYLHFKSTAPEAELDNKALQLSLAGATSPHASVLHQDHTMMSACGDGGNSAVLGASRRIMKRMLQARRISAVAKLFSKALERGAIRPERHMELCMVPDQRQGVAACDAGVSTAVADVDPVAKVVELVEKRTTLGEVVRQEKGRGPRGSWTLNEVGLHMLLKAVVAANMIASSQQIHSHTST
ncbi:hypothetical protein GOP47_0019931 [Adiantum capillus-veneris]|uniref:Uncharacterized protein n=1 Tax=Adiantum capillus-veneris TaxID=13818 RepID=A0A9D4UDL7_ADICA|nr:hypothetical protein GOP47_0019931 [Adiantum capillus-veneris]